MRMNSGQISSVVWLLLAALVIFTACSGGDPVGGAKRAVTGCSFFKSADESTKLVYWFMVDIKVRFDLLVGDNKSGFVIDMSKMGSRLSVVVTDDGGGPLPKELRPGDYMLTKENTILKYLRKDGAEILFKITVGEEEYDLTLFIHSNDLYYKITEGG
ncbi:MAG: hypothetical protein ISS93_00085 [Candidatus Aenigmarchaeota archaeon]|nr:hypothetical protein [Candidatus Aenigmarchaeota archaeon]